MQIAGEVWFLPRVSVGVIISCFKVFLTTGLQLETFCTGTIQDVLHSAGQSTDILYLSRGTDTTVKQYSSKSNKVFVTVLK